MAIRFNHGLFIFEGETERSCVACDVDEKMRTLEIWMRRWMEKGGSGKMTAAEGNVFKV